MFPGIENDPFNDQALQPMTFHGHQHQFASTLTFNVTDSSGKVYIDDVSLNALLPPAGAGTLVSSLVGIGTGPNNVTDADSGAVTGIAITAVADTVGGGTWFYELAGTNTWVPFGNVSTTNALLLPSDALIYFQQAQSNVDGTGTITFQAWDGTSGTAGGTGNASVDGGSTAFSTAHDSASLNIGGADFLLSTFNGDTVFLTSTNNTINATVNTQIPAARRHVAVEQRRQSSAAASSMMLKLNVGILELSAAIRSTSERFDVGRQVQWHRRGQAERNNRSKPPSAFIFSGIDRGSDVGQTLIIRLAISTLVCRAFTGECGRRDRRRQSFTIIGGSSSAPIPDRRVAATTPSPVGPAPTPSPVGPAPTR